MLHLPSERIAELAGTGDVEETPTPQELEHLVACLTCTRELEAHRRLLAMSADERLRIAPPLTDWSRLSTALRDEGLLRTGERRIASPPARRAIPAFARRAAAAVVLVAGGAIAGRLSAGMAPLQAVALGTGGASGTTLVPVANTDAAIDAGARLVAETDNFASPQAALASLERAQRTYESAAMYLATHDTTSSAEALDQYRTRLAALDRTAETMQQALREAPKDPYINQYYQATMNAREQTIRRIGTVMPVGNRLGRF